MDETGRGAALLERRMAGSADAKRPVVPGPVHRVAFFDEQRRNRRATWKLTAASLGTVLVMAIALSAVLSPLLYALALIVVDVVNIFVPLPDVRPALIGIGDTARSVLAYLAAGSVPRGVALLLVAGGVVAFLPGLLLIAAIWVGLRSLFERAGVGGLLLTLGARQPRSHDFEEHQLVNLVEEMALADGIAVPHLAILDSDLLNAAVLGSAPGDATIVVSRRILDEFDRKETEGIIGHLVGSIGNGDLRIAFSIVSLYEALGVVLALLHAPFARPARRALGRLSSLAFARLRGGRDDPRDVDLARELVTKELETESAGGRNWEGWRLCLSAPLLFLNIAVEWTLLVFMTWMVGPFIGRLWSTRRYLADATAVQLTRDPDGLARGLDRLASLGAVAPVGGSLAHLFIVGSEATEERRRAVWEEKLREVRERDKGKPLAERVAHARAAVMDELASGQNLAPRRARVRESLSAGGGIARFHPPLGRRLERLRALGATIDFRTRKRPTGWQRVILAAVMTLVYALLAVAVAAMLAGMVMFIGLGLAFMTLYVFLIHNVLTGLARLR